MAGGGKDLEGDIAQREPLTVIKEVDRELDVGAGSVGDDRARSRRQFEMAAQEVGVDMCLDHTLDRQPRLGRLIEVDGDISAGVYDYRTTGRLVTNEIRGVRQTRQVVLREDHRSRPGIAQPTRREGRRQRDCARSSRYD